MSSSQSQEEILQVIHEISNYIEMKIETPQGVSLETAVACAAYLAGTSLFRTFNVPSHVGPPGTPINTAIADKRGPELVTILFQVLQAEGIKIEEKDVITQIPPEHLPHKDLLEVQRELEDGFMDILYHHAFDKHDGARVAVICAAYFIRDGRAQLDPRITTGIAVNAFVKSTKTIPLPLQ